MCHLKLKYYFFPAIGPPQTLLSIVLPAFRTEPAASLSCPHYLLCLSQCNMRDNKEECVSEIKTGYLLALGNEGDWIKSLES